MNKNQENGIKSDKIKKTKKLKGVKNDEIGTKSIKTFFTNISTFRQTCCNQTLAGSGEKCRCGVGGENCPNKTDSTVIYQTVHELGGARGLGRDETK